MTHVKVTAIIRRSALEAVETRLKQLNVPGISVSTVKGFGEYANFFSHDWMVSHARIELFVEASESGQIIRAIEETARSGEAGDGFVAVLPVVQLIRIRTGEKVCGAGGKGDTSPLMTNAYDVNIPVSPWITLLAWLIVLFGISAGVAVVLMASHHEMHLLAALLGAVLLLCVLLGGLAFARSSGRNKLKHN